MFLNINSLKTKGVRKPKEDVSKSTKCMKCGFENSADVKFCGNCGSKLGTLAAVPKFEGLAILHFTGSIYLLISLIFNALVQASMIFIIPYLSSGLLGLYAGYEFYIGKVGKWLKVISALAIALGLASTFMLFLLGLEIRGVVGPAWAIFLINAWILWNERARI